MPIPDDDLELHLRRFRPLAPEPLPIASHSPAPRRSLVIAAWAVAMAAVLLVAGFALYTRRSRTASTQAVESVASSEQLYQAQPLTIRSANALLVQSPSFKSAVDQVVFPSRATLLSKGKRSALAVLSEEKTRL